MDFKIYHTTLPSKMITNCISPGYRYVSGDPDKQDERDKAQEDYIKGKNSINHFYDKLEESILEKGIRNPILIQAGFCVEISQKYLPKEAQEDHSKILCCDRNGGSRLYIAQKYNMDIDCIISDFCGKFDNQFTELYNEEEIMEIYKDKPKKIIINKHGVHVQDLPHIQFDKSVYPASLR